MRSRFVLALLAAALLAAPAAALAAPAPGPYHGVVRNTPTNPCGGNEGEGFFRLRANANIAPLGSSHYCGSTVSFGKIIAPTDFTCNQLNATLAVSLIPVDATGAFNHTEDAPIGPGGAVRRVTFRGSWSTDTRVIGVTRIRGDGCDDTAHWVMKHL